MNKDSFINQSAAADAVQQALSQSLQSFIGQKAKPEDVRKNISEVLEKMQTRGIIPEGDSFSVGKVEQLWDSWNWKQKLKWLVYNKLPILKNDTAEVRKAIEDYNSLCVDEDGLEYTAPIKIPDHMIGNPKLIYITNTGIKLNQGIQFIQLDMVINPENQTCES